MYDNMNMYPQGEPVVLDYFGKKMRPLPEGYSYDEDYLLRSGFTATELGNYVQCINDLGPLTQQKLLQYGAPPADARLMTYIYQICTGRINNGAGLDLNGYLTLSKHLRTLFELRNMTGDPTRDEATRRSLAVTKDKFPRGLYTELPRRVAIVGIPEDSKFAIFNSDNYQRFDRLYVVKPGTNIGQNITIQTDKQPKLAYRESREIEGILKLAEMDKNGVSDLVISREYVHMHNVFYITANIGDLKSEAHYGGFRIVAHDGTIITVRVEVWVPGAQMTKRVESKRVYEVGFFPEEIRPKLTKVTQQFFKSSLVRGVRMEYIEPTLDFTTYTEVPDEDDMYVIE